MNRLTLFELHKIWGKRSFLISVAAIFVINLFLIWYISLSDGTTPELSAYKAVQEDIRDMSETEKYEYIEQLYQDMEGLCLVRDVLSFRAFSNEMGKVLAEQEMQKNPGAFEAYYDIFEAGGYLKYTDSLEKEAALIEEIHEEMKKVSGYDDYLAKVQDNKDKLSGISIFSADKKEDFSSRNIEKSASDYQKLAGVRILFFPSKGITAATQNNISDALLILLVLLFAAGVIQEEKEKRIFYITRATAKGREQSVCAKLLALGIHCFSCTVLLYGANLFFFAETTGIGNVFRSIQSAAPFMESSLPVTVFTYIILVIGTKAAVLFGVGAFVVFVSVLSRQGFMPYLAGLAVLLAGLVLYLFVPSYSAWNWFKYLNVIGLLKTENIYARYLNFNLFGYPVSRLLFSLLAILLYAVVGSILSMAAFIKGQNMELNKIKLPYFSVFRVHNSLFRHEGYKIMIMNRAAILLLGFAALFGYRYFTRQYTPSAKENYYQSIMLRLEGEWTEEKDILIKQEEERFENAFAQIERIDNLVNTGSIDENTGESIKSPYYCEVAFYPAFRRVLEQYEHVKEKKGEFIYDTGYLYLSGKLDNGFLLDFILLSVCVILAFSNGMAIEDQKKVWFLLAATKKGVRDIRKNKVFVCTLGTATVTLTPWLFRLIQIRRFYPMNRPFTVLQSIPTYREIKFPMTVAGFFLIFLLVQVIVVVVIMLAVLWLSHKLRNHLQTLFAALLIFVIPPLLKAMGFDFAGLFSLFPIYTMLSVI